ncbi:TetR/AcrR family transcriptional regulator C-terminal domain-containing protein [Streptomyces sp. NPDC003077]|uniref:TetR/AcrR family transcriptional regulator C-terminal domain-containing protein n=1 Tax=Streptomyces sp. NPDC003077 TaxID=3154443 RepID=UPI0033B75977
MIAGCEGARGATGARVTAPVVSSFPSAALPGAGEGGTDWRDDLRHLAHEYRRMLLVHPWAARLLGEYINIGPRSMAFSNATMRTMRRSGLPLEQNAAALGSLFQFVYGFSTVEVLHEGRCREVGITMDEYHEELMGAVQGRHGFAEALELADAAVGSAKGASARERRDRDFDFALDLQIAGIEAMRDRAPRDRAPRDRAPSSAASSGDSSTASFGAGGPDAPAARLSPEAAGPGLPGAEAPPPGAGAAAPARVQGASRATAAR